MPLDEGRHAVRDITVRMLRGGAGARVMYLHGAAGLPQPSLFFEELAGKCELLIPEHPGYGLSDHPPWIRNVADMAMYYLDFLDALGGPPVHLVGHSLGGWIAAELAVRNCTRVASLTLLAPAGVRVKGVLSGDTFIWTPEELARNLFHNQSFAEAMIAQAQSATQEQIDLQLTNRFMSAKLGWEPRWFNPALERWLHRIAVPTLVLWGREDKVMPVEYAEVWRQRLPNVRVEVIAECGHLPFLEKVDVTARSVLAFLDGVRR